ncbi:Fic family protein [Tenacibaculum maritimum]|uniref:hypothetical protein n=1 Tax=Tenacibaculum maritimum TaxID=107401 RepID=UPI001F1E6F62|nr:hypothetical protein [Tenacibaculum maritimum]
MGRLWQTLILLQQYPVFGFLPVESLIKENQEEYYEILSLSDQSGHSTSYTWLFIFPSLESLLKMQNRTFTPQDSIELYKDIIGNTHFSCKDYLQNFKDISPVTASRDLKWAVEQEILIKTGDKRSTKYQFNVT